MGEDRGSGGEVVITGDIWETDLVVLLHDAGDDFLLVVTKIDQRPE